MVLLVAGDDIVSPDWVYPHIREPVPGGIGDLAIIGPEELVVHYEVVAPVERHVVMGGVGLGLAVVEIRGPLLLRFVAGDVVGSHLDFCAVV